MERSQQIRYFLFSQYLSDGIRITVEIVIPALVFSFLGDLETGLAMSLGALCVSISDGPGPTVHKRNGMFYCNLFVFISAFLTGMVNDNVVLMGIMILVSCFVFTMFSVYGSRATAVGFAALLIMILQMTHVIPSEQVLKESLLILAGGVWYMMVALLFYFITPYRAAERSIGKCLLETAKYLVIKSELYNPESDIEQQYRKLLDQQVVVNDNQNEIRELLFKNRSLLRESTRKGRLLVLTFVQLVDLFEQIMASWYDYEAIRKKYAHTGILQEISLIVKNCAQEMYNVGEAIQANGSYKKTINLFEELNVLKQKIDNLKDYGSTIMLKKILVNLRNLVEKTDDIAKYFENKPVLKGQLRSGSEYSRFVTHQKISWEVFKNNLTLHSSIFRHSLRVMITCGAGYVISKFMSGHHSYWITMTIIIIMKPAFSLTKKKNYDRLTGTIAGGIVGLLLLHFIQDKAVLFELLVFFMLGTYTFKILNYIVMVIFLTPYVLILFHFLGLGALHVASERLLDTAIGSVLAALGSYFLFPSWESGQLRKYMSDVLSANIHYLQKLKELFSGKDVPTLQYKLVRKELFVSTANLSGALHRMLSEPKSKQKHRKEIYEFVVLNHILSSNVASITSETMGKKLENPERLLHSLKSSVSILESSLQKLDNTIDEKEPEIIHSQISRKKVSDSQTMGQLDFINQVSIDISKLTRQIVS